MQKDTDFAGLEALTHETIRHAISAYYLDGTEPESETGTMIDLSQGLDFRVPDGDDMRLVMAKRPSRIPFNYILRSFFDRAMKWLEHKVVGGW